MITPYPQQVQAANTLASEIRVSRASVDKSEMGVGKTITAIVTASILQVPYFVVAPKAVLPSWRRVGQEMGNPPIDCVNYEAIRPMSRMVNKQRVLTWNNKWLGNGNKWNLPANTLIIFDEAHSLKDRKSLNTSLLLDARDQGFSTLLLSGTLAKSPLDMYATGAALGLHKRFNYWDWCKQLGCRKAPWGQGMVWYPNGYQKEAFAEQVNAVGVRIRLADIAPNLPENNVVHEAYDIGDVESVYRSMAKELAELEAKQTQDKNPQHPLTIRLRGRQKVELMRVPCMLEMAKEGLEEGKSVVLFVNFQATVQKLVEELKCKSVDGQSPNRQDVIDSFNAGKDKVLVVQIQSGGVGISLHDMVGDSPRLVLLSPTYSAIHMKQALGRCYRNGSKSKVVQKVIWAAGSIEEEVAERCRRSSNYLDLVNGEIIP